MEEKKCSCCNLFRVFHLANFCYPGFSFSIYLFHFLSLAITLSLLPPPPPEVWIYIRFSARREADKGREYWDPKFVICLL